MLPYLYILMVTKSCYPIELQFAKQEIQELSFDREIEDEAE